MTKKERRKTPAKGARVERAPVVTHELTAAELVTVAQTMLRAGYGTNGTASTLRVMAEALRTQLMVPACDAETVALHVVRAAYPSTVGSPTKLRAMADVLRPYLDGPVLGEPDERIPQEGRR